MAGYCNKIGGSMKKTRLIIMAGILILSIAGCGTVKGVGDDLTTVGKWLTRGADAAKSNSQK